MNPLNPPTSQTLGGNLSSVDTKKALAYYGMSKIMAKNKYKAIAEKLHFTPYRKKRNGDMTTIPLKIGTMTYKKAVEAELLRKHSIFKAQMALIQDEAAAMANKPANLKTKINAHKKPLIRHTELIKKHGRYEKHYFSVENVYTLKDLYEVIKKADKLLDYGTYATLILLSNVSNQPRRISIGNSYLDNFDDFEARYNQIARGDLVGSDAIEENIYTLVLDTFHLSRLPLVSVEGESDGIIFKCRGIVSKEKLCGYECLKACGFDYDKEEKDIKPYELRNIKKLIEVIEKHNLSIKIVCNGLRLKTTIFEIMNGVGKKETKQKMFFDINGRKNEMKWTNKILDDETEFVFYNITNKDRKQNEYTIIYDDLNSHFDLCENTIPELKEDLRISLGMELIINNKVLMTAHQCNKNALDITSNAFKYIFFDYETVIDFKKSSCMIPYSLSILVLSEEELDELEKTDKKKDEKAVKIIRGKGCKTFLGYDCSDQFINWFVKNTNDLTYCFVGFNNCNFDNFLLLDALLNFDMEKHKTEFSIGDIFYNGSQLLNFKIDKRHTLFDIRKHLVGSLKANCEAFKINCCAKKSFEHAKAQRLHDDGELINFITGNDELKEYNEFDVLATAVLFKKYQNALLDIPSTAKYAKKLKSTITIGSLIYEVFTDHITTIKQQNLKVFKEQLAIKQNGSTGKFTKLTEENEKLYNKECEKPFFGKMSYQMYKDLQKHKIAGRVELFNGVKEIFERMASTDVCSLYPFVMAVLNCWYPYGEILEAKCYQGDERIGFYYCDIDQSNLKKANKPKIYARKTAIENDWNFDDDVVLKDYLISNVMIGLLHANGCKVIIKNGFVFKYKSKSCEMFKFILEMMEAKNKQDTYKDSKDPEEADKYIAPLRETLKLLQNSLSGKVIEGLHIEKTVGLNNCAEYDKETSKATSINFIDAIGGKLFVSYEVDEEELCKKEQRPIFLGVLIYDYAKRYMYENSYSKIGLDKLFYTDTDASKFKYEDMGKWREWIEKNNVIVPHWPEVEKVDPRYKTHLIYNPSSKVYGSFEDELDGMIGEKYAFYCLEKKSWAYAVLNEDGTVNQKKNKKTGEMINNSKFKFKGVNGQAIILTGEEDFIEVKTTKSKGEIIKTNKVKCGMEKAVYDYAESNKHKAIEAGNEIKFFKQLYETKEAYLLTNSFRKIVKNSARNVKLGDDDKYNKFINQIQVNYVMKHIQIREKEPYKQTIEDDEIEDGII